SNTATVSLTVAAVNDAPVASDAGFSTAEDTPLAASVTASDVDSPTLTFHLVVGPVHGSLVLDPSGSFTYTPSADFNGSDTFTFVANDGLLDSNTATVSLTVAAVNDAPVAADASFSTDEDAPLSA